MKNLLYCVFREAEEKRGQEPFAVHGLPGGRACIPARGMMSVCKYAHPTPFLLPAGVDGGAVRMLAEQGLAAAVSAVPEREESATVGSRPVATAGTSLAGQASRGTFAPTIPRAMAFARVVEALHAAGTVLPMRYGCLLDAPDEVMELLRRRRGEFLASLDRLEGCAEMGIRVLLPEVEAEKGTGPFCRNGLVGAGPCACPSPATSKGAGTGTRPYARGLSPFPLRGSAGEGSGRGYLGSRRTHYATTDSRRQQAAATAESIRSAFSGLSVQFRWEPPALQAKRVLSLHFLIRRESVADFRRVFSQFQEQAPIEAEKGTGPFCRNCPAGASHKRGLSPFPLKVMLTGPWPPYHFAASDEPTLRCGGRPSDGLPLPAMGAAGVVPPQTCGVASIEGPGGHRLFVRAAADGQKP